MEAQRRLQGAAWLTVVQLFQLVLAGHAAQPREAKWSNQPIAMERSSAGRGAVSLVTSSRMARGSAHELIELGQQYESIARHNVISGVEHALGPAGITVEATVFQQIVKQQGLVG